MNTCYVNSVKFWVQLERGDIYAAAPAPHKMSTSWPRLTASTQSGCPGLLQCAASDALLVAHGNNTDRDELPARIERLTKLLDMWRRIGLEVYRPLFDGVIARLLLIAGDPDRARAWLDTSLEVTAPNWPAVLRCRETCAGTRIRQPTRVNATRNSFWHATLPGAKVSRCWNCAQRSTISSYAANPRVLHLSTWSAACRPREVRRNWRALRSCWLSRRDPGLRQNSMGSVGPPLMRTIRFLSSRATPSRFVDDDHVIRRIAGPRVCSVARL